MRNISEMSDKAFIKYINNNGKDENLSIKDFKISDKVITKKLERYGLMNIDGELMYVTEDMYHSSINRDVLIVREVNNKLGFIPHVILSNGYSYFPSMIERIL